MEAEPLVEPLVAAARPRARWRAPVLSALLVSVASCALLARGRERAARARAPGGALATARARQQRPSPAAARWLSLSVSNEYERRAGRRIGDGLYPLANLVEIHQPTRLSVRGDDAAAGALDEEYAWEIGSGLAAGAGSAPAALSARGDAVEATFVALGAHAVRVTAASTRALFAFEVNVKYVRRELRELSDADREHYFKTLEVLYRTPQAEGEALYGPDFRSAAWFVREHLYGAAQRECDHWHDDAGFLTHHVGVTLQFEHALRAVDPTTCSHYWDYTVDALANASYAQSEIFSDDWFGAAAPADARHVVSTGRWAYTPVMRDAERKFSNITNAHGLLRSPWNTNPAPFLGRSATVIGVQNADYTLPDCEDFRSYVAAEAGGSVALADVVSALNGVLHGPVHIMIGGHWGFNASVVDRVRRLMDEVGKDPFPDQILLASKFLWRQGYVECPAACADGAPCSCALNPAAYNASALNSSAARDAAADAIFERAGVDAINPHLVETWVGHKSIASRYIHLREHEFLEMMGRVGHPGEMFTSAAPQDPIFWPLHGLGERLVQLLRLMADWGDIELDEAWGYSHKGVLSDTHVVCDWSGPARGAAALPACTRNTTCPGHREDDVLPFENVLADAVGGGQRWYTNAEFYAAMSPIDGSLPYVYDKLMSWPGCSGGTLFNWIDARNSTNATTYASNVTATDTSSHPEMKSKSSTTEATHGA